RGLVPRALPGRPAAGARGATSRNRGRERDNGPPIPAGPREEAREPNERGAPPRMEVLAASTEPATSRKHSSPLGSVKSPVEEAQRTRCVAGDSNGILLQHVSELSVGLEQIGGYSALLQA